MVNPNTPLVWSEATDTAFATANVTLSDAPILYHSCCDALLGIPLDALDAGVGVALEKFLEYEWHLFAFSAGLSPLWS